MHATQYEQGQHCAQRLLYFEQEHMLWLPDRLPNAVLPMVSKKASVVLRSLS